MVVVWVFEIECRIVVDDFDFVNWWSDCCVEFELVVVVVVVRIDDFDVLDNFGIFFLCYSDFVEEYLNVVFIIWFDVGVNCDLVVVVCFVGGYVGFG